VLFAERFVLSPLSFVPLDTAFAAIVLVGMAFAASVVFADVVFVSSLVLVEDAELLVEVDVVDVELGVLFASLVLADMLFAASVAFAMLWFDALWFNMLAISSLIVELSTLICDALSACVALSSVVLDWLLISVVLSASSCERM
jgi:hypothetical protein